MKSYSRTNVKVSGCRAKKGAAIECPWCWPVTGEVLCVCPSRKASFSLGKKAPKKAPKRCPLRDAAVLLQLKKGR